MNRKSSILFRLMIGVIVVGLLGLNLLAIAQASPAAQDPRPPVNNGGGGGGGGGGTGGGGNAGGGDGTSSDGAGNTTVEVAPIGPGCAGTTGQVINWGFGPQGDIGVELNGGGWRTAARSASDGNYGFGGLGVGVAKLHVGLAPAQAKQVQPLIQDAGVYLNCKYATVANIAIFSGSRVDPPANIEMTAPSEMITPASNFEVTLTVQNSLPTDISNVIVTDLMPRGFKVLKVNSSVDPKDAQIVNGGETGQLVALYWDKLASKAKVTIRLTLNADVDLLNGTKIRNTATLFYRESAADQAWLDFTVGTAESPILASSGATGNTGAEFVPPANAPTTGGNLLESTPGSAEPAAAGPVTAPTTDTAGETVVPPGNMPSTGGEIELSAATLNPEGQVNLTEAQLVVGREVKPAEESAASVYGLTINTGNSDQSEMIGLHEVAATGPSVIVAAAVFFLGLLVLGSGLTMWRRRFDS